MNHSGYDPAYFKLVSNIEDRHFWFRTRQAVISSMVRHVTLAMKPGFRILEIGCGTGNVLRVLQDICPNGEVVGMDLFSEGLKFARNRNCRNLVRGDIHAMPFADRNFDIIGLFDVLEHLPNDVPVLLNLYDILANNGVLLLTVPAHPAIWSYFDDVSHHYRRYELNELNSKLTSAGFRVEYITYYMSIILPLIWVGRYLRGLFDKRSADDKASSELRVIPLINDLLTSLLSLEARLIARKYKLSTGTSLLVVARKWA